MRFTITILLSILLATISSGAIAANAFDGSYRVNGKDAKLAYLLAQKGEPFHDMPTTVLVFSEKDASHDDRAVANARTGQFGDALVVTLCKTDWGWDVLGGEFVHSGIEGSHHASSSGIVKAKDVTIAGGEIRGHLKTDAGEKLVGQSIEINLNFHVKQP